jgi:hypothetical protein
MDSVDKEFMLTTLDNPYNPFTQYDDWYNYDVSKGYNTCAYLARVTKSSPELSEEEEASAIDQAMNEIVEYNLLGKYIKVQKDFIPRTLVTAEK